MHWITMKLPPTLSYPKYLYYLRQIYWLASAFTHHLSNYICIKYSIIFSILVISTSCIFTLISTVDFFPKSVFIWLYVIASFIVLSQIVADRIILTIATFICQIQWLMQWARLILQLMVCNHFFCWTNRRMYCYFLQTVPRRF